MQYPACAARCKYEINISLMRQRQANTNMDRGRNENREAADEMNAVGGGEKKGSWCYEGHRCVCVCVCVE